MFCKNCGTKLNGTDKYCSGCGSLIDMNIPNTDTNNNLNKNGYVNENNQANDIVDFNEKLIKTYIGSKADKMYNSVKKSGICIWALLFGTGYFVYRKMYLITIIIIILSDSLNYFIPNFSDYVQILIGFTFFPIYKWDITRKLRKIKKDNPTADENQLLSIAKDKGGTSMIGLIVFFIILIVLVIIHDFILSFI